jgi:hypothetical protein
MFIFRVEKYILEQIEALEDKVAAASMQVPVSTTNFVYCSDVYSLLRKPAHSRGYIETSSILADQ